MKTEVSQKYRRYYLSEFSLYDGDHFITFNIVDINTDKNEITVAISNEGNRYICCSLLCNGNCFIMCAREIYVTDVSDVSVTFYRDNNFFIYKGCIYW